MIANQIRTLFAYSEWAWQRVFDSVEKVDAAAYHAQRPLFGATSLHKLLVHSMAAEVIWLTRCLGHSPQAMLAPDDYANFTAVAHHWAAVRGDWADFLGKLTNADMSRIIEYHNTRGDALSLSLVDLLQHVLNHATEHRSQITPMLYQLGFPTPPLDYMRFRIQP